MWVSSGVLWFPPTSQKHAGRWIGDSELPRGEYVVHDVIPGCSWVFLFLTVKKDMSVQ